MHSPRTVTVRRQVAIGLPPTVSTVEVFAAPPAPDEAARKLAYLEQKEARLRAQANRHVSGWFGGSGPLATSRRLIDGEWRPTLRWNRWPYPVACARIA